MAAVRDTWSKRCDRRFFILAVEKINNTNSYNRTSDDDILYVKTKEDKFHLTIKVLRCFEYLYKHFWNQFDWILKADDDSYILVENLRHLLSHYNPSEPGYLGYHMKPHMHNGYMDGGSGFVISKGAFQRLAEKCFQPTPCYKTNINFKDDDVAVGLLLQSVNVSILSSLDRSGRETFHTEPLDEHAYGPYPRWNENYGWNKPQFVSIHMSRVDRKTIASQMVVFPNS